MRKIAFCFLCKDRLKNISLWKKFFTGNENKFNIYFHFSEKNIIAHKDFFNSKTVPNQQTSWGDIYRAIFSLYKSAFNDKNFKYILLSESCIPVKNFLFIYEYLTTDDKSFLFFQSNKPTNEWEKATLIHNLQRYIYNAKKSKDFMYKISIEDWFYSDTWNILNKEHVALILNNYYLIEEFKSMKCFAYDENIVSYLLSINNKLDDIRNIKTTFVNWKKAVFDKLGRHPYTYQNLDDLNLDDFEDFLFARKFHDIKGLEGKILF